MMRFILDCLRPTRQRAGERDISLEKVDKEKDGLPNQQNHEIQELQEEMACEELGLKEEQEQRHETQEALEKLANQRGELKKQIELIQQQRKEERQLLLSLQEEQEELEQSVHEYEEELSRAQEELQRLQEDITQAERKVEGARVRISPLQNSISQSYAEISRAQQRLGELIAELIAVEGPVAIGIGHQTEEEAHTEDYTEEGSQEDGGEQEELSDQDLQLHTVDDDAPCGESARAEEPDRPNPADNLKSSGSSSFTEITLTEVKEEEGSSPRSITPQIDSPDFEEDEEEEEASTVQSLMTQTSSRTTIGQFDFYHPDPFTDNDLFRDDLFPKVEVADSTDGFFSDPFKGTDPFASDYLFSQLEEEQFLPVDHLEQHESEPKPELCISECMASMDDKVCSDAESCSSNEMEHVGDSPHEEEQFDSPAGNTSTDGLETRGECDGFEISIPICSESSHRNYSSGDLPDQNHYSAHLESRNSENPGPLERRDQTRSVDLSNEEGWKSKGLEFNNFFPLITNGDDVGQCEPMECVLLRPQASDIHRCDPDGSERSGSPLMDIGKCSLAESKVQVRRHFSCEATMALCTEISGATECPEPICHGNDRNGYQFEDSDVCDENQLNGQCSQRIRGSSITPKFCDQELTCRTLSNTTNCDSCVFELCHHYPSEAEPDTFRASSEGFTRFSNCVSTSSQADNTGNRSSGDYEFVEDNTLSPQIDVKNDDMDGTGTSQHNHYSPDLNSANKQDISETQYQYPDPFSPEQNETVHFNFSGLDDVERNILIPISSSDAGSFELKANNPFSPDLVESLSISTNCQQVINLDPCHLGLCSISRCEPVGSKNTGYESFSSEPSDRASCDSSGFELGDTKLSSSQYSDDYSSSAQKISHIPDISPLMQCGNFTGESEDFVSHCSESKDKLMVNSEPSEFRGLNCVSPKPDSDSGDCHLREYNSGCYDTSKSVSCDLRPPELMQFDPFSPEPSDAEMCDVGSESNHSAQAAFFETAPNGPSPFSSWDLESSMFTTSNGTHSFFEQVERYEYTPTGTSSDDSVRGHPFDSESSETTGWSLSESETSRLTDQNLDVSEQDGCCSELNKVARSSRHSSVPDSIAEMLFGPEPNTARFYPWDIENSNTIVCDNHSPEDSPDTVRCDLGLRPDYDINGSVTVNSGASEVPNLR